MSPSTSFRDRAMKRPSEYRTPSPPRYAVEPLSPRPFLHRQPSPSPTGTYDSRTLEADHNQAQNYYVGDEHLKSKVHPYREPTSNGPVKPAGSHSRSKSTIDTLATIALATSPTFSSLGLNSPRDATTTSPTYDSPEMNERPSKRAKSEKAPSPSWQGPGGILSTSHVSNIDSMKTDAELLLNFARPTNFPLRHPEDPSNSLLNDSTAYGQALVSHTKPNDVEYTTRVNSHGAPVARLRSRSDGAAAHSRSKITGLMQGASHQPPSMCPVLEDDVMELDGQATTVDSVAGSQPIAHHPAKSGAPSAPLPKPEKNKTSSSSTNCAACNLDRAPTDIGDDAEVTWVNCDGCHRWFHIVCAGFKNNREIRTVDKFICRGCRPAHGPTTFVRKSSRPRTAIDYAGLNQGFVKPPTEATEHHHIKLIKNGGFAFLPDHFARFRPELVTADFFERGKGMMEPIVIPAQFNPRTSTSALGEDTNLATTEEEFDDMIDTLSELGDTSDEFLDCGQDLLDMVIPDGLTVKAVGELYGGDERIEVIDVKSQQGEDKRWTMQKWVDYYYDNNASKVVRNVISLEVSQCPLGRLIRRPKIVRDWDLQDSVWPTELQAIGDFPKVQFYVLMSVADCYTDFHIDFGGSSVYYHILKGKKTFFFIPPKDKHLKKYEEWCNSASQDAIFLGNETKECYRVDLSEGDTMLIPSGWIHAVWTPEDSLVIGGNFLTRMNYGMQLKITKIEKDTKVPRKFRYPHFQKIMWYTALKYLAEDPLPTTVRNSFEQDENYRFPRQRPIYDQLEEEKKNSEPGTEYYNSRFYSKYELNGLHDLSKYLLRTALIAGGYKVDGVTKETRAAVGRSVPKGQGDPVELARNFGLWVAWKRGNELAPQWTRPDAISPDMKVDMSDKRRNGNPTRRSERTVSVNRRLIATQDNPQVKSEQTPSNEPSPSGIPDATPNNKTTGSGKRKLSVDHYDNGSPNMNLVQQSTPLGPKRVACGTCRKRRIRCRHRDIPIGELPSGGIDQAAESSQLHPGSPRSPDKTSRSAPFVDGIGDVNTGLRSAKLAPGESNETLTTLTAKVDGYKPITSTPSKKGRAKACDECRKSKVSLPTIYITMKRPNLYFKRRCIHDEAGRIDPLKFQEGPKVRASKEDKPSPSKQAKSSNAIKTTNRVPSIQGQQALPGSDVKNDAVVDAGTTDNYQHPVKATVPLRDDPISEPPHISPPQKKTENDASNDPMALTASGTTLVSPPTSLADELDNRTGNIDGEKSRIIDGERNADYPNSIHTPTSLSGVSSRQPTLAMQTSLPSEIPQTNSDYHAAAAPNTSNPISPSPSQARKLPSETTPLSLKSSSPATTPILKETIHDNSELDKKKQTSQGPSTGLSPISPQRPNKANKRDRASFTDADTDEDSLKLIRQLQEEDFGLRKRRAPRM